MNTLIRSTVLDLKRSLTRLAWDGPLRAWRQWRAPSYRRLEFPKDYYLSMATNELCNARCIFCAYPHAADAGHLDSKNMMPLEMSQRAIAEIALAGGWSIGFSPIVGDPLVDPLIFDRIRYARHLGIRTMMTTNGILLSERAEEALAADTSWIDISIGGTNREDYKSVYGVDSYPKVIAGVEKLLKLNKAKGEPSSIGICFRPSQTTYSILESGDFKSKIEPYLSRRVKVRFTFRIANWGGHIKKEHLHGALRFGIMPKIKGEPCNGVRAMVLRHDGTVRICGCAFITHPGDEMTHGRFPDKSLRELAEENNKLMEDFRRGDLPKVCTTCTNYTPIHKPWSPF